MTSRLSIEPIKRSTLTVVEVAEYLGISKDLVYMMVREKQLPHVKLGRRILFKIDSVERWLAALENESLNRGKEDE